MSMDTVSITALNQSTKNMSPKAVSLEISSKTKANTIAKHPTMVRPVVLLMVCMIISTYMPKSIMGLMVANGMEFV